MDNVTYVVRTARFVRVLDQVDQHLFDLYCIEHGPAAVGTRRAKWKRQCSASPSRKGVHATGTGCGAGQLGETAHSRR